MNSIDIVSDYPENTLLIYIMTGIPEGFENDDFIYEIPKDMDIYFLISDDKYYYVPISGFYYVTPKYINLSDIILVEENEDNYGYLVHKIEEPVYNFLKEKGYPVMYKEGTHFTIKRSSTIQEMVIYNHIDFYDEDMNVVTLENISTDTIRIRLRRNIYTHPIFAREVYMYMREYYGEHRG